MAKTSILEMLRGVAKDKGLELDPDELAELGLSDEILPESPDGDVLSTELDGTASAASELFLGESGLDASTTTFDEKTGIIWAPIIREGQFAVRPGPAGQKRRVPLKIIAGHSKNARKEIGLADLHDAFHETAIQHVTVPTSHANTLLENQGFVKDMKIVTGTVSRKGGVKLSEPEEVAVLMGGYDITEPETKGKMERGTIANRSAGILYDYCNTESGKVYPAVVEHVALTNKPWITGMKPFFRALKKTADAIKSPSPVALSLSDVAPTEDELIETLSLSVSEPQDWFDEPASDWSQEESPNWLRQQVDHQLREARRAKEDARRTLGSTAIYEERPYYRCVEAKPGSALVSDDYGDDSNFWNAPIEVKDGAVVIAPFKDWAAIKKTFVPDTERAAPEPSKEPLSDDTAPVVSEPAKPPLSRLQLAQEARRARATGAETNPDNTPRGGAMTDPNPNDDQLSEGARKRIADLEAQLQQRDQTIDQFSERLDRVSGTLQSNEADKYINSVLKPSKEDGGLGLSEANGFGGVLTTVRDLLLADDGEPAVQAECFSTDSNKDGELSLSEAIKSIFTAFKSAQEGGTALSEVVTPGTEVVDPAKAADSKDKKTDLSQDGKPATTEAETPKADHLKSNDELLAEVDDDEFLKELGIKKPANTTQEA